MQHTYHTSFSNFWMTYCSIFKINGTYPFTTRFNDVFASIHNLHITIWMDLCNIACIKPSIFVSCAFLSFKISFYDCGSFHKEPPKSNSIFWQFISIIISNGHINTKKCFPLFLLKIVSFF